MAAPPQIHELIERFDRNREAYTSPQYNETQLRREFIDPLFESLGWDMTNKAGNAEAYKDVIHEDAIKIGGATKAPDYCFRIGGTRKFFLEAKKPSVNIKEDTSPAFQLRRYAYSAKLPLSILSDFEELAVYDCRIKPVKTDKASVGRTMYLRYTEYPDRWDEVASRFSRDAVLKGSFDKYVESSRLKKGTTEVDDALLGEIERWRDLLAHNIAIRNPKLSQRELNFAVQRTIDRVIFLRICEDRGVELYGRLQSLLNGANIYRRLIELFRQADEKYNSGIFHFMIEKGRAEEPDKLTPGLDIDDKTLKEIIGKLYYPDSPYEFSVMPADILGQVYEQFLGKVIRLTAGHRAVIEDKPEVKKAGGVYYTPTYIVDYIVKNTVGSLVGATYKSLLQNAPKRKPMTPKDVSKLKILDPACGSGSFLIGAYQYLLDWHRDWYLNNGDTTNVGAIHELPLRRRENAPIYQASGGEWRLTTAEKKRILLNNIFGVDIDTQAVEVTKLSLLLKVLEGESVDTIANQKRLFHQQALPDLGNNIKCGNSLIGPDFYENQQMSLLDEEEKYRINVFDWKTEFPDIIKNGGFDAVIGNPPYGFHQIHSENVKPYFKEHFASAKGSFEHYFLFYERSLGFLNKNGIHGFIVPVTWLTIPSALSLRKFILDKYSLVEICWLPELVFRKAQVNTLVSTIKKSKSENVLIKIYDSLGFIDAPKKERNYKSSHFIKSNYFIGIFEEFDDSAILKKISSISKPLKMFARPCSGYNPYEIGKGVAPNGKAHTKETVETKPYHSLKKIDKSWKPEIVGRDLGRYSLTISGKRWIKYGPWLAAQRDPNNFLGKRILVQEITGGKTKRIIATYFENELYHSRDVIPIKIDDALPSPLFLLGVINSNLISWYHHKRNPKAQKGLFPKVLVSDLQLLPIYSINFSDPADKSHHDRMVELVERMLELNKRIVEVKTEHERVSLRRQIEATDGQIDRLVYELYGLTEEEIKIVEE